MGGVHDEGTRSRLGPSGPQRLAIETLMATGRPDEAATVARTLLATDGASIEAVAQLRLTLSSIQLMRRRSADALQQAEAVAAQPGLSDELYTAADVDRLTALVELQDMRGARDLAEAILSGRRRDSHASLAGALNVSGLLAWRDGRLSDALTLLRAAARRAELGDDELRRLYPRLSVAPVLTATGQYARADAVVEAVRREVARLGDRMWAAGPSVTSGLVQLAKGQLGGAVAAASAGLELSEQLGTRIYLPAARFVLASVALLRGSLAEAAEHLVRWRNEPTTDAAGISPGARLWTEARLADASGDRGTTLELLRPLCDDVNAHRGLLLDEPAAAAWLVRAALAVDDRASAVAVAACTEQLAVVNAEHPVPRAAALHARGVLDGDPAVLIAAAAGHRQPWAKASAFEDAGTVQARRGNRCAAAGPLHEAHAIYTAAGADRDAERVCRRLRDASRGPRRRARHGPTQGWASLTDTEARVARCVASGRTNIETAQLLYMSRHTVDTHLRKIFQKLGIRSRVALALVVAEQGVASTSTSTSTATPAQ
jgi:DNA-binding CsgD family transcriptional regulator